MPITHTSNVAASMRARAKGTAQSLDQFMERWGRLTAVSLATETQPFGIDEQAKKSGEIATASDIRRCYATPAKVYQAFPNPRFANAFWASMQKGQYAKAQSIMQANCAAPFNRLEIRPFDGGAAHRANRNKRGRVSKKQTPVFVVQSLREFDSYIKQEVDRVGLGKSGWAVCARILGGIRGIPHWIARHKTNGSGVQRTKSGAGKYTLTLINGATYADQILSPASKTEAVQIAANRLFSALVREIRQAPEPPLTTR